jgi:isoquinoline 1-oxidoreductase alpha subunit
VRRLHRAGRRPAARACITPLAAVRDAEVRTIEGIAQGEVLHPVQQAFLDEGAMQCGFCVSGMMCSAVALLREQPQPSDRDVVTALHGNVCRCGTCPRILRAVQRAAAALRGGQR